MTKWLMAILSSIMSMDDSLPPSLMVSRTMTTKTTSTTVKPASMARAETPGAAQAAQRWAGVRQVLFVQTPHRIPAWLGAQVAPRHASGLRQAGKSSPRRK